MCEAERLAQVVTISRFSHRLRRLQERQPVCVKKRGRAEEIRRGVINIQTRSSTSPPRAYNHCNTVVLSDCVHARVSPVCVFCWFIFHLNRMGLSTLLCLVSFHKTDLSCCAFCAGWQQKQLWEMQLLIKLLSHKATWNRSLSPLQPVIVHVGIPVFVILYFIYLQYASLNFFISLQSVGQRVNKLSFFLPL